MGVSVSRDRFVEVQDGPCRGGPGGEFDLVERRVSRRDPHTEQFPGGFRGPFEFVAASGEQAGDEVALDRVGGAREGLPPQEPDPVGVARAGLAHRARGQAAGRFDERGVVEEHERRLRRIAPHAGRGALLAVRGVEREQLRVEEHPLPVDIEAPPPLSGVGVGLVLELLELLDDELLEDDDELDEEELQQKEIRGS